MNDIRGKIKRCVCLGKIIYRKLESSYINFEHSYLENKNEKTILKFLLRGIVVLSVLLILVILFPPIEFVFNYLTGEKSKLEFIKIIGWGMSGLIAIFGVIGLLQRASAQDEQNKITRDGQRNERMKTAKESLASKDLLVRIASFNDFYYLASIEPDLQKYIFITLHSYLQQKIIKDKKYKPDKPTEEMQSLLDILFEPYNKGDLIFRSMNANLAEANLQGADLQGANLQGARLQGAHLQGANLQGANLQGADLQDANLQGADLRRAHLQGANLRYAKMQKANLLWAELQDAFMQDADLQGAILRYAEMQKVNIVAANLQGAELQGAELQEAILGAANLQGANLSRAQLQMAGLLNANLQGADLQGANLQGAKINEVAKATMPLNWENDVEKNEKGETGVLLIDDKYKVIEYL